jgi:hypothetical protein
VAILYCWKIVVNKKYVRGKKATAREGDRAAAPG